MDTTWCRDSDGGETSRMTSYAHPFDDDGAEPVGVSAKGRIPSCSPRVLSIPSASSWTPIASTAPGAVCRPHPDGAVLSVPKCGGPSRFSLLGLWIRSESPSTPRTSTGPRRGSSERRRLARRRCDYNLHSCNDTCSWRHVAVDATDVYFSSALASGSYHIVNKVPIDGGVVTVLVYSTNAVSTMTADATNIYFYRRY